MIVKQTNMAERSLINHYKPRISMFHPAQTNIQEQRQYLGGAYRVMRLHPFVQKHK